MQRRTGILTAALVTLAAVSACTTVAAQPQTAANAPPPTPKVDPALRVENPKNLEGIQDACLLLTLEQRDTLRIDGAPEQNESLYKEPSCKMSGDALSAGIDINTKHGGMTAAHERKGNFDNFEPTEVAGYPAVLVNFADTVCSVAVGVSDTQSVDIFYAKNSGGTPEMDDSCGYGKKIAAEVLENIPAA